jgi:hypothetical protein
MRHEHRVGTFHNLKIGGNAAISINTATFLCQVLQVRI